MFSIQFPHLLSSSGPATSWLPLAASCRVSMNCCKPLHSESEAPCLALKHFVIRLTFGQQEELLEERVLAQVLLLSATAHMSMPQRLDGSGDPAENQGPRGAAPRSAR